MNQPPEPESLGRSLGEVCRLKHKRMHTLLHGLGLHRGQPSVLRALWEEEGLTHTELTRRLNVRPATITKMIARMERAGFVERRSDPHDQRISRVYLTETGRNIREEVQRIWHTLDEETLAGFTPQEQELLRQFLLRIRENLNRLTSC